MKNNKKRIPLIILSLFIIIVITIFIVNSNIKNSQSQANLNTSINQNITQPQTDTNTNSKQNSSQSETTSNTSNNQNSSHLETDSNTSSDQNSSQYETDSNTSSDQNNNHSETDSNTSNEQNNSQSETNSNTSSDQNSSQSETDSNTTINENTTYSETPNYTDFVNIKLLDSSIIVELVYNTSNNFTGKRIYNFDQAILRTSTAQKLVNANLILKSQGYVIKIWDAYRPLSAQEVLWQAYPDPNFVAKADPNNIRGHQLGATIDMTICTLDGIEVDMQSKYDDFSSKAYRSYERTEEQENNYNIMNNAMIEAGFIGYVNEWWEYRDTNQDFVPLQVDPNKY